jgi:hypothetical protein
MFKRFYAYPPTETEWPWILRNIKQSYRPCKHEIVDIGIYDLLTPPYHHSIEKLKKWDLLKPNGWKVVPDCPDLKGEFGQPIEFDSVEYSWRLLTNFFNTNNDTHIPVLQCEYGNLITLQQFAKDFKTKYGEFERIAIGTLCRINNVYISEAACKMIRRMFPHSWIHVFGMRIHHLRRCWKYIDSFDSSAWTFPREPGHSAKNIEERREYFRKYVERIEVYYDKGQTQLTSDNRDYPK